MADPGRPDEFVEYRLVRLADRLERRFAAALAPYRLTPRQFSVLVVLDASPGATSAELARTVLTTPQGMHTLVDQLERRGLVERGVERGRGRAAPVRVTSAGRDLTSRAVESVRALDARTRARLGDDYARLSAALDRLEDDDVTPLVADGPAHPGTADGPPGRRDPESRSGRGPGGVHYTP